MVGKGVVFGPWAQVGAGAVIGDGAVLGSHTRVQPGVQVPENAVFDDHDLVTPYGVLRNRVSGFVAGLDGGEIAVSGVFGQFRIPAPAQMLPEDDVMMGLVAIVEQRGPRPLRSS